MSTFAIFLEESIPDYQYEELKTPDEIRLITILPGNMDDDIVLRISHQNLPPPRPQPPLMTLEELQETLPAGWEVDVTDHDQLIFFGPDSQTSWTHPDSAIDPSRYLVRTTDYEPQYEALSYTWGDLPDGGISATVSVYIQTSTPLNGLRKLSVTSNLAAALRTLRLDDGRTRPIWIDAISINQACSSERNTQVLRMADIYRLASRVIVWLGSSSYNSSRGIEALSRLAKQSVWTRKRGYILSPDTVDRRMWDPFTDQEYDDDTLAAINELVGRPWFRRLWVVQEIQLARSAILYCGMDQISWDWFRQAAVMFSYYEHMPRNMDKNLDLVIRLVHNSVGVRDPTSIVQIAVGRLCTDPRDLVYGLMGILPSGFREKIEPDYRKGVKEVYKDLMLEVTKSTQRLEMLPWCSLVWKSDGRDEWPTWVPDLRKIMSRSSTSNLFAAGYSCSWAEGCGEVGSVGNRGLSLLRVEGTHCATVRRVVDVSGPMAAGLEEVSKSLRALYQEGDESLNYHITGEPINRVYVRTLCLGMCQETYPEHDFPSFETWVQLFSSHSSQASGVKLDLQTEAFVLDCLANLPCFFDTEEGYFGLCATGAKPGDIVSVLLGCSAPMVLRPDPESNTQTVVGPAFAHGLHEATALLGVLPADWRTQIHRDIAGYPTIYRFFNPETGELSDEDPRLEPLPEEWKRTPRDRNENDPMIFQCFENTNTGGTINYDPRMTPESLRARGVDIRTFCLA